MALIQESYLNKLLNEIEVDSTREEKQARLAINKKLTDIQKILKKNVKQTFNNVSLDTIVRFMEFSVEIEEKFSYAQDFVTLFFQRVTAPSQFYIRALLVKAKLIAYKAHSEEQKGQQMLQTLKRSLSQITKALDLISGGGSEVQKPTKQQKSSSKDPQGSQNKQKYNFLIFNTSTCLYKIIRFMLKPSWLRNFTQIVERICKLFQEVEETDYDWRCRFMMILFQCLYDAEKKADAWKILDLLWEKAKAKNVSFLEELFRLRVHYSKQNGALSNSIKKDIEGSDPNAWKVLESLQKMKSGLIPEAQIEKELMSVVNQISLGILSNNDQPPPTLSPILQQRLSQCGRIALRSNLTSISTSITSFLQKLPKLSQKCQILNEYNKAELLIKKKNQFIDKKTGMMMGSQQIKEMEVQRRKQAIRVLQKVMAINKRVADGGLIYQGAVIVWNISLPFLCPQYRESVAKVFEISCQLLEQIDCTDHDLRTKMHLELAKIYFGNEKMFPEMESNIRKALKLDHSIPSSKMPHKFQPTEDPSLYYRPLEKYLISFREKILLKNLQAYDRTQLDNVINDLWTVAQQKSQTARMDTLQKCLKTLLTPASPAPPSPSHSLLVPQEIEIEKILQQRQQLRLYKKRKLLAYQVAEIAFQWELNDFAKKAALFVLEDVWEAKNSKELLIAQARCCYFLAQIYIDQLIQENFQIPYAQPIHFQNQQGKEEEISEEKKQQVQQRKIKIFEFLARGLEIAESIQQHWLVFNGAIYIWNNFLHIFRNPGNDPKLHKNLIALLKSFFEAMRSSLKQIESKGIVYYDLDTKIQTFANIGLIYARLMEYQKHPQQVIRVCQALLITPLSPHSRKLTNNMKARVTGNSSNAAKSGKDAKKGGKDSGQQEKNGGYSDSFLFDVFNQLEIIQNCTNKAETENLIKKCFENLQNWEPKQKDESELQLHAQLWARLSRLAVNESSPLMLKYALNCCDKSLQYSPPSQGAPQGPSPTPTRLRWYSLAHFLSSDILLKLISPDKMDKDSIRKLGFGALSHAVQSVRIGFQSNVDNLIVDGSKQFWNVCTVLKEDIKELPKILDGIKTVIFYLRESKQDGEGDLVLLLAGVVMKAVQVGADAKVGEEVIDMMLQIVPRNMQRVLWESKMVFMAKQGKNQLQALSNMKQSDPSLQAKLWQKLARISSTASKQHTAYNKALQILQKQGSIEIVELLIEYSEWQLRVGNQGVGTVKWNLLLAADYLVDVEFCEGEEDGEEGEGEDRGTVFSRSTRGKKSYSSKSVKSVEQSKIRKNSEKKGSSSKSKGSSVSRMNRSGRVAKASKSKNSKSIFTERQQDPNPESLNCIHFQRLFRIHTILAMISDDVISRIQYALDAKQFLLRILQLSLNTINEIQQNSLKFAQKSKTSEQPVRLTLPQTLQQWLEFQLPKQLIEKVKSLEDPNLMGTYTFEKPELTFTYMGHLANILINYGLTGAALPVLKLQHFIAVYIVGDAGLALGVALAIKRQVNEMNCTSPIDTLDIEKLAISQSESKAQMAKTQAQALETQGPSEQNIFKTTLPPNAITPFRAYESWLTISQHLFYFGQILQSKNYLQQSIPHLSLLGRTQLLSQAYILLSKISSIEGDSQQSLQYSVKANSLCRSPPTWHSLLHSTCRELIKIGMYQDAAAFASKIYQVLGGILRDLQGKGEGKGGGEGGLQAEVGEILGVLTLIEILDVELRFTESLKQQLSSPNKTILSSLKTLEDRIAGDLWCIQNYQYFLEVAENICEFYIHGGQKGRGFSLAIFEAVLNLLIKLDKKLVSLTKYTLVSNDNSFKNNKIVQIYHRYRFLIANCLIYKATLEIKGIQISDQHQNEEDKQQKNDEVDDLDNKPQVFKKFMRTLDMEIQKRIKPLPLNLSSIEQSISILQQIKNSLLTPKDNLQWQIYYSKALTVRARAQGHLSSLWRPNPQENNQNQILSESAALSLEFMTQFLENNYEEQLTNYVLNPKCYVIGQELYEAFVQNTGNQMSQKCFEFLCKMQHFNYTNRIFQELKKNLSPDHKFITLLNLVEKTHFPQGKMESILKEDKIFSSITKFDSYEQCISMVPQNAMYISLQLCPNLSQLLCGVCYRLGGGEVQTRVHRAAVEREQFVGYLLLRERVRKIGKEIVYLPYSDPEKFKTLLEEKQKNLQDVFKKFVKLSSWWLEVVTEIINKPREEKTEPEADKGKKGGAKEAKKKPGKDEVGAYQSPLGASPSGIESITFLLDEFFDGLPFNLLPGLSSIPAISFDSSIFHLTRKMKSLSFSPQQNNSLGFNPSSGKYISFAFKSPSLNFPSLAQQLCQQNPGVKFQGICSSGQIPSINDFVEALGKSGYLHIYGSVDTLNRIKIQTFLQCCANAKVSLLLVTDHLNYQKSQLVKLPPLQGGQGSSLDISIDEESKIWKIVASLLGVNLVKNYWGVDKEGNSNFVKNMYKSLANGYYLGAITRNNEQNEDSSSNRLVQRWMNFVYGCPVLRM